MEEYLENEEENTSPNLTGSVPRPDIELPIGDSDRPTPEPEPEPEPRPGTITVYINNSPLIITSSSLSPYSVSDGVSYWWMSSFSVFTTVSGSENVYYNGEKLLYSNGSEVRLSASLICNGYHLFTAPTISNSSTNTHFGPKQHQITSGRSPKCRDVSTPAQNRINSFAAGRNITPIGHFGIDIEDDNNSSIKYHDNTGTVTVEYDCTSSNANKYAILFEDDGTSASALQYVQCDSNGKATFVISKFSDYGVAVSDTEPNISNLNGIVPFEPFKIGSQNVEEVKIGSTNVSEIYRGTNLIWVGGDLLTDTNDNFIVDANDNFVGYSTSSVVYPVKGDLIMMELGNGTPVAGTNNLYRVLSINNGVAEVVAMYDMVHNLAFNSSNVNTYSGGTLDNYLNTTFYNTLSSTAKAAIVDKNIVQYEYAHDPSVYNENTHASYADYSTKASKQVVGNRHVYALDVGDIETYFNNTFSKANIWTLFWNTSVRPSTIVTPWLRSANTTETYYAWRVNRDNGFLCVAYANYPYAARPALTIDLSKISWTPYAVTYTITPTLTNVTASSSNPSTIAQNGTATLTFTANSGYSLPSSVTVSGATYTWNNSTGVLTLSNPTENVTFSIVGEITPIVYPTKGDIVTIENNRYRVLDISGSHAKIFGLFDAVSTSFDSLALSNTYEGSTLDTALNTTWFGQQSTTFQNAVDDSSIATSTYQYSDPTPASWTYKYDYNWTPSDPEYATRTATASAITRKVYALDLKDYYDYKGTNTTTSNDLMKFFFEGDGTKGGYSIKSCWLRSANAASSATAWCIAGATGIIAYYGIGNTHPARPALTIDLSKISFTIN